MLYTPWDWETALRVWYEEGEEEGARKIAKNMKNEGMSVNDIMMYTDLTVDDILKL
jgi:(2Fe-2S) ferredoxin